MLCSQLALKHHHKPTHCAFFCSKSQPMPTLPYRISRVHACVCVWHRYSHLFPRPSAAFPNPSEKPLKSLLPPLSCTMKCPYRAERLRRLQNSIACLPVFNFQRLQRRKSATKANNGSCLVFRTQFPSGSACFQRRGVVG